MLKILSGLIALPVISGVLHFIITALLAGMLALTYSSLTQEQVIATVSFDKVNNQANKVYNAHLYTPEGTKIGDYVIYGDQWRIDAEFIKVKYWANVLGVDSKYTLNRFEGRYKNIRESNSQRHKAYQLESHALIENLDFFFDTTYGASVYQDIHLKTKYMVIKTPSGLMVRNTFSNLKQEKSLIDKTKSLFGL